MDSLNSMDCDVSIMSLDVAPKCTYSPALFSHASASAFTSDAMSWLVSASISDTLFDVTCFVLAFDFISTAASFGIIFS